MLFGASAAVNSACQSKPEEKQARAAQAAASDPGYALVATIKEIMMSTIDPSADVVWNAVHTVVAKDGTVDIKPVNDEQWKEVRYAALRIAEGTNLLRMPGRHVAHPGEKSETPGVELEPAEMEKLINDDLAGFRRRADDLRKAALDALAAIDAKDTEKLFIVGEHIDQACENCHLKYWYPNQVLPPGYEEPPPAAPAGAAPKSAR
jgi:hypothetical protein